MFQRILVPLDGSTRAEQALPAAARLAKAAGEKGLVILVRVVNPVTEYWMATPLAAEPSVPQSIIDTEISESSLYLSAVAAMNVLRGVRVETVVIFGSIAATILATTAEHKADIIVMCSHGYTGMKRWVMGSIAEKIARHSPVPVFIEREGGILPQIEPDAPHPLRTIVPLDGSTYAKAALVPAAYLTAALAGPAQGTLHLTRVVTAIEEHDSSEEESGSFKKASTYLSATVDHIREGLTAIPIKDLKLALSWSVAHDTDVAGTLVRIAEHGEKHDGGPDSHYDVIAIATHGRGGLQRWALGSITERVLNSTRLPVLVIRPPDLSHSSDITEQKAKIHA